MPDEIIVKLLENIGFPAAVCFYTLFGVNKTLKELTGAINKLSTDVERRELEHAKKIEHLDRQVHELSFKVEGLLNRRFNQHSEAITRANP